MLTINLMQRQIMELKKEKGVVIVAHNYISQAIREIADHVADSYSLTEIAQRTRSETLLICGARYIAETCKVLCPKKKIILVNKEANCPMAERFTADDVKRAKKQYPGYALVCYINTSAEIKALCDVCVTSSTAVNSCRKIPNNQILFLPDVNLGSYIASKVPEKTFAFLEGCCPTHAKVTAEDVIKVIAERPGAKILAHPTCGPDVLKLADFIGSTADIIDYAKNSSAEEFIIGTEIAIAEHLQYAFPEKRFYPLSKKLICRDMKIITLHDVYDCLMGRGGEEIELASQVQLRSLICINKMFELNG
ncbi:MAG: quinolinate synthase NadA [Oscillospiraceae bacterium]|nr:quinolinate synthase NadA [Oscillospiraceae bacterium]